MMKSQMQRLKRFFLTGLWSVRREDVSPTRYVWYQMLKGLSMAIELSTTRQMAYLASALTYSTLLAFVPVMSVVFAIARGFGYNKYIEEGFREALASQPQVAETIIGFVNSYLVHAKSGVMLGVGLLLMFWTVLMLIRNIERAFNIIWQVKKPRSLFRTVTDYLSMFIVVPLVIVVVSGVSVLLAAFAHDASDFEVLAPVVRFLIDASPYVLMSSLFVALYLFMPNTKVRLRSAIVPGILAGVAMQGVQLFYVHSQLWVSGYNAIYGSFAALPLFMLWLQASWTICLFGAELCYTSQNLEEFAFRANTWQLSHRHRIVLSVVLAAHVCRRFARGERPMTALELKLTTGVPIRITNDLLYDMVRARILVESTTDEKGEDVAFLPAEDLQRLSVGALIERLERQGHRTIDVDLSSLASPTWQSFLHLRDDFSQKAGELLLKDVLVEDNTAPERRK